MRVHCQRYPEYLLFFGNRRLQFRAYVLTTDDPAEIAFIRAHPDFGRLFTEIADPPPASTPATTCAHCQAAFPDEGSLRTHLQTAHGTPLRSERSQRSTIAQITQAPTKAAGAAGLEPFATCDHCRRSYQPRTLHHRFCSLRCRVAHHRATASTARNNGQIKRSSPTSDTTPSVVPAGEHLLRVTLPPTVPNGGSGTPANPKTARLDVEITAEDALRLRRLARTWRESVGLTVNRLIRRGLQSYRGEYRADEVTNLPKLPPLPPRKRHSRPSVGVVRLEAAGPGENAVTIATADLVREAMNGGKR